MFNPEVSEETMNKVKELVVNSGGEIYQEFVLIKGFAAKMNEPLIQTLTKDFSNILSLEDDNTVLFQEPGSPAKPQKRTQQQSSTQSGNSPNDDTINVSQPQPTVQTTFTIHHFNPVTNPINTSNADALLQMENAFVKSNASPATGNVTNSNLPNPPSSVMIPMPSTFISKRDGRLRWCERCNYVKSDRCHHCSECDKLYTSLYADFAFAAAIPILVEQLKEENYLDIQLIVLMILGFLFGLLLTGFTIVHTTYLLQNRTTIESISFRTRTYHVRVQFDTENPLGYGVATTRPGENLWDLGWKKNWKYVMGDKWWLWCIPFGNPPGNGLVYPFNPDLQSRLIEDARRQSQAQEDRMNTMMQQAQQGNTRGITTIDASGSGGGGGKVGGRRL
ncbi:8613_t:CDS:2 [Funneliformis geosporum]|uniref:19755_t:CDS:1 n=1 Tax=Funneliformis geosporum TaxID=1117311 RepID=A0A9W4SCI1_9GLOM|nr:8613_t:CDS:2 [Funneliformis geosporum]CAI2163603.1 19755_t:CDS:2 [Funneliformis geosporum]